MRDSRVRHRGRAAGNRHFGHAQTDQCAENLFLCLLNCRDDLPEFWQLRLRKLCVTFVMLFGNGAPVADDDRSQTHQNDKIRCPECNSLWFR